MQQKNLAGGREWPAVTSSEYEYVGGGRVKRGVKRAGVDHGDRRIESEQATNRKKNYWKWNCQVFSIRRKQHEGSQQYSVLTFKFHLKLAGLNQSEL